MNIKNKLFSFLFTTLFAILFAFATQPALASGLTSTDSASGQVTITTQDGATYLTTELNDDDSLFSNRVTRETFFTLPVGFALNLGTWITSVASLLIAIVILMVFFQLIMGGFSWITSGGDKGKTDEARGRLVAALVGMLIIAASYAVLIVLLRFLGFESISDAFNNVRPINSDVTVLR